MTVHRSRRPDAGICGDTGTRSFQTIPSSVANSIHRADRFRDLFYGVTQEPDWRLTELTELLRRLHNGDRDAFHDVIPLVYDELKKLARAHLRREAGGVSLETTALVHEAF